MITNIEITGVGNFSPDDRLKKYIRKKIGSLDRLAPRHARKTMRADVKIEQVNRENANKYEVGVVMQLPGKTLTAKDTTMNAMAATDIVEAKLAAQLRKYHTAHLPHVSKRKLLSRFKRSFAREQQA